MNRYRQFALLTLGGLGSTRGRALAGPEMAEFGVSDHCDQFCIMCRDHPPSEHQAEDRSTSFRFGRCSPGTMSLKTFKGILDDLQELGTRRIEFAGRGEPLMNPSITKMVDYAKKQSMHVVVYSNGSRLTEELAEAFISSEVDILNISLNAGRSKTYPRIHAGRTQDDFNRVKHNTRFVTCRKSALGSTVPLVQVSFMIGAVNLMEIEDMLRSANEMGAQRVVVSYAALEKDADTGMRINQEQLNYLRNTLTAAEALADELGLESNLSGFRFSVPHYLEKEVVGPAVVPCYAGWYTVYMLANGCVLPCAQSIDPVGRVTETRSFTEIWQSQEYRRVRMAARSLPRPDRVLSLVECDRCTWRSKNIAIHNFIRPWRRIECGNDVEQLSLRIIPSKLMKSALRQCRRKQV